MQGDIAVEASRPADSVAAMFRVSGPSERAAGIALTVPSDAKAGR